MLTLTQGHLNIKIKIMVFSEISGFGNYGSLRPETLQMQTTCEVNKGVSRSFHDDLILQDQASGERSQDQWSSGLLSICVNLGPVLVLFLMWVNSNYVNQFFGCVISTLVSFIQSMKKI